MSEDDYVDKSVRRRMMFDGLRRLRKQVDAETAQDQVEALWARRLGWFFALAALLAVLALLIR